MRGWTCFNKTIGVIKQFQAINCYQIIQCTISNQFNIDQENMWKMVYALCFITDDNNNNRITVSYGNKAISFISFAVVSEVELA